MKDNPFLTEEDIKRISNSNYNPKIVSKKFNTQKGEQTNFELAFDFSKPYSVETRAKLIRDGISAQAQMSTDIGVTTGKRVSEKIVKDIKVNNGNLNKAGSIGKDAALMTATVSGITNIIAVSKGEKDIKTAALDIAKDTSSSFITAGGISLIQDNAVRIGANSLTKTLSSGLPIAAISTSVMIARSVYRLLNDEITAEECACELLLSGVGTLAYSLGSVLGTPAAGIVVSIVATQICSAAIETVLEYRAISKDAQRQVSRVNSLAMEALQEMEKQRNELKNLFGTHFEMLDKSFEAGFEAIIISAFNNNADGTANGFDIILGSFGEKVRFKSAEEFDDFFMDENNVFSF